ncbi:MAG: hypothetical protein IJ788_01300 [Oscillospiraceae bacterium]|nr:hypothetical protein [Oscillospiraceae bacterium]
MADDKDRRDGREAFRRLSTREKIDHIWTYYKWFIILGIAAIVIISGEIWRFATKKEPVLYLGLVNVTVGAELESSLDGGFTESLGLDARKNEVLIYRDLYISDSAEGEAHKSAYASRIKLMAAVESKTLDAVLMSRQAYDILSAAGYLMELDGIAPADILTENEVVLEDNDIEYTLNEASEHIVRTETRSNGARLDSLPGFDEPVYFAVIANTEREAECGEYLRYLLSL